MKHFTSQQLQKKTDKGFALLLSVVLASILLSITYIMFSISLKQLGLSTSAKNSELALYTADTGIECGLYTDNKVDGAFVKVNSNSDGTFTITTPNSLASVNCNGVAVTDESQDNAGSIVISGTTYSAVVTNFTARAPNNACAKITISKYIVGSGATEKLSTKIEARGYNTCTNLADPQRVERGLEVYY